MQISPGHKTNVSDMHKAPRVSSSLMGSPGLVAALLKPSWRRGLAPVSLMVPRKAFVKTALTSRILLQKRKPNSVKNLLRLFLY